MAQLNAVLGACIRPSIHDPLTGNVLAQAEFSFFSPDKITPKNVYQLPDKSLVYPNPLVLDSIGSEPPIYYDTDEAYWIEIRRPPSLGCECLSGELLYSFFFYPDSIVRGSNRGIEINNFIPNGQFKYSIPVSRDITKQNVVSESDVSFAMGWRLESSGPFNDDLFVNLIDIQSTENLDGNPVNFLEIICSSSSYDFINIICDIGKLSRLKNEDVTLLIFGKPVSVSSITIEVFIRQVYGDTQQVIDTGVGELTFNNAGGESQFITFTMPDVSLIPIDEKNSKSQLILKYPANSIFRGQITNVQLEIGTIADPIYIEQPSGLSDATAFFKSFIFPDENQVDDPIENINAYDRMIYTGSKFSWYANTGIFAPILQAGLPSDMEICSGQTVKRLGYTKNGVPYDRLWNVWGSVFGANDGFIATSDDVTTTIKGGMGGKVNSTWDIATLSGSATLTNTEIGLKLGFFSKTDDTNENKVLLSFFDKFAPRANPSNDIENIGMCTIAAVGWWRRPPIYEPSFFVQILQVATGSPTTFAQASAEFSSSNQNNYKTIKASSTPYPAHIFESASVANPNSRGNFSASSPSSPSAMLIIVSVDGQFIPQTALMGLEQTVEVKFLSTNSMKDNIKIFNDTVNNSFEYELQFSSFPAAGQYFLLSSSIKNTDETGTDYYCYCTVDGSGTDPALPGKTGIVVPLFTGQSLSDVAAAFAAVLNSQTFNFPNQADLPTISNVDIKWAAFV